MIYTTTDDPSDGYSNHWSNGETNNDLDYSLIDNIELDGIDTSDYPDFSDAFILSADYNGEPMDEQEIEQLNEDSDFVHEEVINQIF
jgi:hypothetical protein